MDETELEAEYNNYWETRRFYEDLDNSWGIDEALSCYCYSSTPDGPASSSSQTAAEAKNTAMERNRRRKLTDNLYALRSVVPKITKMDKASIIKDAIDHIQELQAEERRMMAEVAEFEAAAAKEKKSSCVSVITQDDEHLVLNKRKGKRSRSLPCASESRGKPSIKVTELKVCAAGEKSMLINITCNKEKGTLVKLCELLESLKLKIMSSNITSLCKSIMYSLFVVESGIQLQTDEMNTVQLKQRIEAAIAEYGAMTSPTSSTS